MVNWGNRFRSNMKVIDAKKAILIVGLFVFKYLVNFVGGIFFRAHLIHPRELPNTKKVLVRSVVAGCSAR